jgi:hypothetical protein
VNIAIRSNGNYNRNDVFRSIVAMSIKASEYGKQKIKAARKNIGWTIDSDLPLLEASRILEPNLSWVEGMDWYAIAKATWRRFVEAKPVREENFKVFCEILDLEWRDISQVGEAFDIRREPQESRCERTILEPASFLRIKGPHRMGKTRMLDRVLKQVKSNLEEHSHNQTRIITVNFLNNFDLTVYDSLDNFLKSLCQTIAYELTNNYQNSTKNLTDTFQDSWHKFDATPTHKTSVYFENWLLDLPLILVLENIDRVFEAPFSLDFCDLLRGWHTKAQRGNLWQNLSLVIVHSTDVYATMDIASSPLANVGEVAVLEEFGSQEIERLVKQYDLDWDGESTAKIMALVGGNPDLVDLTLQTMANESITLDLILSVATTESGIYRGRLLKLWETISKKPHLKLALKYIIIPSTSRRVDPLILYQLESLGLVKIEGDRAIIRNELYRQYFTYLLAIEDN